MNLIMGKNTIIEIIKSKPEILLEVFTHQSENNPIIRSIRCKNIPVKYVSKKILSNMVKSDSHQNIVAKIKSRKYWNLKEFIHHNQESEESLVIMLDSIYDPQNLGSILRACSCFSADGVIFSKNRGTDITCTTTKAGCGATELLNLIKVSNLANSLDDFIDYGYSIIATSVDVQSRDLYEFNFPKKTVIIMGSEGEGVQKILLKKSNHTIHIPMSGKLEPLNVSQATAIILSTIRYQAR